MCNLSKSVGSVLLLTLFICYSVQSILFWSGISTCGLLFPLSVIAAFVIVARIMRPGMGEILRLAGIVMVVLAISILVASVTEDYSYDGNIYHQEIIMALMSGWNPFYDSGSQYMLWTMHYAKAVETVQADIALTVGRIEAGKAFNLILLSSAFSFALYFVGMMLPRDGLWRRLLLTVIAVGNPAAVSQTLTYMIDFAKYYYMLVAIVLVVDAAKYGRRFDYVLLFSVIVMAICSKFNMFFEIALLMMAAVVWFMMKKGYSTAWKMTWLSLGAVVFSVLFVAYHPYITNIRMTGNPLYPLLPDLAVTTQNPVHDFGNRFINFIVAVSTPAFPTYAAWNGAFTVFMPLLLLMSLSLFIVFWKKIPKACIYVASLAFASCFLTRLAWWGRFIPQLWFVVPAALLALESVLSRQGGACRLWRAFTVSMYVFAVSAVVLVVGTTAVHSFSYSTYRHALYDIFRERELKVYGSTDHLERHFRERGVTNIIRDDEIRYESKGAYFMGRDEYGWNQYSLLQVSDDDVSRLKYRCRMMPEFVRRKIIEPERKNIGSD